MSADTGSAFVSDSLAGSAALVSAVGVFQEFQFHEAVSTIAGCMAIAYYLYKFWKWVRNHWDNP